jgi:hypothetical protein
MWPRIEEKVTWCRGIENTTDRPSCMCATEHTECDAAHTDPSIHDRIAPGDTTSIHGQSARLPDGTTEPIVAAPNGNGNVSRMIAGDGEHRLPVSNEMSNAYSRQHL